MKSNIISAATLLTLFNQVDAFNTQQSGQNNDISLRNTLAIGGAALLLVLLSCCCKIKHSKAKQASTAISVAQPEQHTKTPEKAHSQENELGFVTALNSPASPTKVVVKQKTQTALARRVMPARACKQTSQSRS
jgi:hypothetical protein